MHDAHPVISAVIPCRNEKDHIEDCLRSILAQEAVPGGFEVLVADGMSDDGTREMLSRLAKIDQRLRIIENPGRVTACGMNAGIQAARGTYIAIMGAHNKYAPDYLKTSLEISLETAADNVGGSMTCIGRPVASRGSRLQNAIAMAHHSPFSVGGACWHNPDYEGPADTVFGGFYRREVFDKIGLFDESLVRNQDDELNFRLTRSGGTIWHSPRIKSWYYPRASLGALFRQYLQYGYWKVRVMQKHRRPAAIRHLVPGLFVGSAIALLLLGLVYPPAFWLWLVVMGFYLLCDLVASAVTAARHGWAYLLVLVVVFPSYHFGYGAGFLCGVIDFVLLGRGPSTFFTGMSRVSDSLMPRT
jgi:glycosyltransferase involved in cell wall biosynthesis